MKINSSVAVPTPKSNQHLVQVLAAALNPVDYKITELPIVGRLLVSKPATPCVDFAGRITKPAAGSPFKVGQLVFGVSSSNPLTGGALAEFNAASIDSTVALPEGVTPVHGASIPVAGLSAYQSIVPHVKKGDLVFINGGSGGVGVFGIQIAKILDCHVTTACSTGNVELCKSLGADEVIDYKKGGVVAALKASGKKFNHIVDNVGGDLELIWEAHEVMEKPQAKYVMVGGVQSWSRNLDALKRKLLPVCLGGFQGKVQGFWPKPNRGDLEQIAKWMAEGKIKPVVEQKFAFDDAPKAFEQLKTGRTRGKIVVEVTSEH